MKLAKRLITFSLAAALALSLAACGGGSGGSTPAPATTQPAGSSSATEPIKLTMATFLYVEAPHRAVIDRLVEEYNKIDPNVQIEISGAGYADYWNNLTTEILANNETDIMQIYPENLASYQTLREGGAFLDLTDRFNAAGLEGKLTGQETGVYDGKTLGVSNYSWGTTAMFYRKSMLEEKGIDPESIKTQDDFLDACRKFSEGDSVAMGVVYGTHAFSVSEWNRLIARPVSNGLYFADGETAPYTADHLNCNSEANVWAAQWWNDFIATEKCGKLVLDKKDSREMFWNGEVPFCMDGPWFIGMCQEHDAAMMDDIGIIPQFDVVYNGETYKPNPTNFPVLSLISSKCEHPDEAWDFLLWMTSAEAQKIIADCGQIPASIEYASSDEYKAAYPLSALFYDFMENNYTPLIADPAIPEYSELSQVMIDAAAEMFTDTPVDVKPILDEAHDKMAAILGS